MEPDADVFVDGDEIVLSASTPWVRRTRLLAQLEMTAAPIVMVSAAAGSGKSTLARQWTEHSARPHATVVLAPHLDDPAALANAVIDAMELIGPAAQDARSVATAVEPTFSADLLPAMARLAGSRSDSCLLVLDDLHVIGDPACQRILQAVCDGMPPGSQVLLLGRATTPTWLARARAEARLVEFDGADLAFDAEEADLLFAGRGLSLPAERRARIIEHTEGWPVGLYLSALAIRDHHVPAKGRPDPVPVGSDRFIADYLASQVLDGLEVDLRTFLVRSSILDELTGPLCDAVLQRRDSARVLALLHERIQLVVALDDERRRFRYHHLLADALRAELSREDSTLVPELHRRAASWYANQGELDAAIRHARWSGDLSLTGTLVFDGIGECIGTGHPDLLRQRMAGLSDRQVASDRWLCLSAVFLALMTGDMDGMSRWLNAATAHAGSDWREVSAKDPYAAALAFSFALIAPTDLRDMVQLAGRALSGLPPDSSFRPSSAFLRGVGLTLLRDVDGGKASMVEARDLARTVGVPVAEADALAWLGVVMISEGQREEGARQVDEAAVVFRKHHLHRLATGAHAQTAYALVLALRNDRKGAVTALASARRLSASTEAIAPWFAVCGRLLQARTAVLLGDGATARLLIAEAKARMTPDLAASLAQDFLETTEQGLKALAVDGVSAAALTSAEVRVLLFLPSHLTFRQIGERMFLSQNTVKTHALSIYRKLGVTSRDESIVVARSLGLIDANPQD